MEWNGKKMENNGENSGPLTSLPVDRLTATNCNAAARANNGGNKLGLSCAKLMQAQTYLELIWSLFTVIVLHSLYLQILKEFETKRFFYKTMWVKKCYP